MKYRMSKMSRVTAAIITIALVVCLAFSMMTYFGNTNEGGMGSPITGNGSVSNNVAGAGYDINNATMISPTSEYVKPMGATVSGNNVVYEKNNMLDGAATRIGDNAAGTKNQTTRFSSSFPTSYVQLPSYGAYDLSALLQSAVDTPGNGVYSSNATNRVFGNETKGYMNAHGVGNNKYDQGDMKLPLTPNTSGGLTALGVSQNNLAYWGEAKGKGIYMKKPESGSNRYNASVAFYANIALPDMMIPKDSNISFKVAVDADVYGNTIGTFNNYYDCFDAAIGVYAANSTENTGFLAPFGGSTAGWSVGINHAANGGWVTDDTTKLSSDFGFGTNKAVINDKILKYDGNNAHGKSNYVSADTTIPKGTRYLRLVIAFENKTGRDGNDAALESLISNLRIMLWDDTDYTEIAATPDTFGHNNVNLTANGDGSVITNEHGGKYTIPETNATMTTWTDIKYFDFHFDVINGQLPRNVLMDPNNGIAIKYKVPGKVDQVKSIKLGALKVLGEESWEPSDTDYVYIVEEHVDRPAGVGSGTETKFVSLDGSPNTGYGGVNIRLAVRTGAFWLEGHKNIQFSPKNSVTKTYSFGIWDEYEDPNTKAEKDEAKKWTQVYVDPIAPSTLGYTVAFSDDLIKADETFSFTYANKVARDTLDFTKQQSEVRGYYYDFGPDPVNLDTLKTEGAEITDFAAEINTAGVGSITGLAHGKHNVVIFMRDQAGNVSLVDIDGSGATGEKLLTVDLSTIGTATSLVHTGTDTRFDEASGWYLGNDLHISITATPATSDRFIAGLRYYIEYFDPTDTECTTGRTIVAKDMTTTDDGASYKATINIDKNVYKYIRIKVVNIVDYDNIGEMPAEFGTYATYINNTTNKYLLKRDDTTPLKNSGATLMGYGDHDREWKVGAKDFKFMFNTADSVMFTEDVQPILMYKFTPTEEDATIPSGWITFDFAEHKAIIKNNTLAQRVNLFIGEKKSAQPGTFIFTDDGKSTGNAFSSYGGKLSIKVAFPNAPKTEYYYDFENSSFDTNASTSAIDIMVDNVVPDATLIANYVEHDLAGLAPAQRTKVIRALADATPGNDLEVDGVNYGRVHKVTHDKWFYGTVGMKVVINNYGQILSRDPLTNNTRDAYIGGGNVIYDRAGDSVIAGDGKNRTSTSYITFSTVEEDIDRGGTSVHKENVNRIQRNLGFKLVTGAGNEGYALPDGFDYNAKNHCMMKYDNNLPDFTFKIGNKGSIKDVKPGETVFPWYDSAVSLDIALKEFGGFSGSDNGGVQRPSYVLTEDHSNSNPFATSNTYTKIIDTNSPTEAGIVYTMTATNIAGKSKTITYTIKIDKDADAIEIKDWHFIAGADKDGVALYNPDKIKYVASTNINNDDAIKATLTKGGASETSYYFITSKRDANDNQFAYAMNDVAVKEQFEEYLKNTENPQGLRADVKVYPATYNGGTIKCFGNKDLGIKDFGDKFAYIVTRDAAGNVAVHTLAGSTSNELKMTIDDAKYTLKSGHNGNGSVTTTFIDRRTGKTDSSANNNNLHVNNLVHMVAEATNGSQFLGYYEGTAEEHVDNDKESSILDLGIDYIDGNESVKKYTRKAMFKIIVSIEDVTNNIQKSKSPVAFTGTHSVVGAGGQPFTIGETTYLAVTWDAGQAPSDYGVYGYKIVIEPDSRQTYWMQNAYAGNLTLTDREVINVIFDNTNSDKKYIYNNEVFLDDKKGGTFLVADKFIARNIGNKDLSATLVDYLKGIGGDAHNESLAYTITMEDSSPVAGGEIKDVGHYIFKIEHIVEQQPETVVNFLDYEIKLEVHFEVVPREVEIVANESSTITKTYDGNNSYDIAPELWDWALCVDVDRANIAPGEDIKNVLMREEGSTFTFNVESVAATNATLTGVKVNPAATNYVLKGSAGGSVKLSYKAAITPREIKVAYNGTKTYVKEYDATNIVLDEDWTKFENIGGAGSYWIAKNLDDTEIVEKDRELLAFAFDRGALIMANANVSVREGDNYIIVNPAKARIVNRDGSEIINYVLKTPQGAEDIVIENVTKITINRATVTVEESVGARHSKEFDGQIFRLDLDFGHLVGEDADNIDAATGIPTLFMDQDAVQYKKKNDNGKFERVDASTFTWDKGEYKIIIGKKDKSTGKVLVGTNYILDSVKTFTYSIAPKNLVVKILETKERDAEGNIIMQNMKYYDALPIGGDQVYTKIAANDNTVDFSVVDLVSGTPIDLVDGYQLRFEIGNKGAINVGEGYVLSATLPDVFVGGTAVKTDNYKVTLDDTHMLFNIVKRPIAITPNTCTVDYVAGKDVREMDKITSYGEMHVTLFDKAGNDNVELDPLKDAALIDVLAKTNYDIRLNIVDMSGNNVVDANKLLDESIVQKDKKNLDYTFKLLPGDELQNFDIKVKKNAKAYIKQVEYFVTVEGIGTEEEFDDTQTKISAFDTLGQHYHIYRNVIDKDGNVRGDIAIDNTANAEIQNHIAFYRVKKGTNANYNNDGTDYDFVDALNGDKLTEIAKYGVGDYQIRLDYMPTPNNNYKFVNITTNNVIQPITMKGSKYEIDESRPSYELKVTPINIKISRSGFVDSYGKVNIGQILGGYTQPNVKNAYVKGTFAKPNVATSKIKVMKYVDGSTGDTGVTSVGGKNIVGMSDADFNTLVDAGKYYLSFDYFKHSDDGKYYVKNNNATINKNYVLEIYDVAYVEINPVKVYVKFAENAMTSVYNGTTPTIPSIVNIAADGEEELLSTIFYDEYGAKIEDAALEGMKIHFKAVDNAGNNAVNASNIGYKVVIDNDAANSKITGNYILDTARPILVTKGYTDKYTITRRPVTINMIRDGGRTGNEATYGGSETNDINKLDGEFKASRVDVAANTGIIAGEEDTVGAAVDKLFVHNKDPKAGNPNFSYKYEYVGDINDGKTSVFNIYFLGVDFGTVEGNTNYDFTVTEVKGFNVNKKVIYTKITGPTIEAGKTYGDEGVNVSKDQYAIEYYWDNTFSNPLDSNVAGNIDNIATYLSAKPTIAVTSTPKGDQYSFTVSLNKTTSDWVPGAALTGDGLGKDNIAMTFAKAYFIEEAEVITFDLKKKDITIDLVVKGAYSGTTSTPTEDKLPADVTYYTYAASEFNPNETNALKTPYELTNTGLATNGDKADTIGFNDIYGSDVSVKVENKPYVDNKDFLVFTVSFAFDLTNSEYYNIITTGLSAKKVGNTTVYSKDFYVKKGDASIKIVEDGDASKQIVEDGEPKFKYSNKFFEDFKGSVTGLPNDFDQHLKAVNIAAKDMKFFDADDWALDKYKNNPNYNEGMILKATKKDQSVGYIILDETKIDQQWLHNLERYYIVDYRPSDPITFKKAPLLFGRTGATYTKTYSIGNYTDKNNTETAIFMGNLANAVNLGDEKNSADKKYIYDKIMVDGKWDGRFHETDESGAPIIAKKSGADYDINILGSGKYDRAKTDTMFMANPEFFKGADFDASKGYEFGNPLVDFIMDFEIDIKQCDIEISLRQPKVYDKTASGKPIIENGVPKSHVVDYSYEYGTNVETIRADILRYNIEIMPVGGKKAIPNGTPDEDGYIIDPLVDANRIVDFIWADRFVGQGAAHNDGTIYDVGSDYLWTINFALNSKNPATANYNLKAGTKLDAPIDITKKKLYVKADRAGSNVVFTSVFGDIYNDAMRDEMFGDHDGLTFTWYEKDANGKYAVKTQNEKGTLTYADINKDVVLYATSGHGYTANYANGLGYGVSIKCTNPNYEVYTARVLDADKADGTPVMEAIPGTKDKREVVEKFLYTITSREVVLNGMDALDAPVGGTPNERLYGITYGDIKAIYNNTDDIIDHFAYASAYPGWDHLAEKPVKGEVRSRIKFKLTNKDKNYTDFDPKTVNDSTVLPAGTYIATYYLDYTKNESHHSFVGTVDAMNDTVIARFMFRINKVNVSDFIEIRVGGKPIVGNNVDAKYTGGWHDDAFEVVFKNSVIDMSKITYTINGVPAKEMFGESRPRPKYDKNGALINADMGNMLDAGKYVIKFAISDAKATKPGTNTVVKIDARANYEFKTPVEFTYNIAKLGLNDLVNTSKVKEHRFNNWYVDDDVQGMITFKNSLVDNKKVVFTVDGQPFIAKEYNKDKDVYERTAGYIRNVGDYPIRVTFSDEAKGNAVFIKNFEAESFYDFTIRVNKADVTFNVNPSEAYKTYKEKNEVKLADTGIAETYRVNTADKDDDTQVRNFSRTYIDVNGKAYPVDTPINELPVGVYMVRFHMNDNANYTAVDKEYQVEIKPQNINYYIERHIADIDIEGQTNKDTVVFSEGVTLKGLAANGASDRYKAEYSTSGVKASVHAGQKVPGEGAYDPIADIFKKYAYDKTGKQSIAVSYRDNIKGVKVDAYIGKKLIATFDTIDFALDNVGEYRIEVSFITDENVTLTSKAIFYVKVFQLNLESNPGLVDKIEIVDGVKDPDNKDAYVFDFNGKTPELGLKLDEEVLDIASIVIVNNDINKVVTDPISVGNYTATLTLANTGNYNGKKDIKFTIKPVEVAVSFGENAASYVYGTEYDILGTISDTELVKFEYYTVDAEGKLGAKLEAKPVNAGKYAIKAIPVHEVASGAAANVVITGTADQYAYEITKANFDASGVSVATFSGKKIYDGESVEIPVGTDSFVGIPEGSSVALNESDITDVGTYPLTVTVTNPNYESFVVDYGNYEITKATLSIVVDKDKDTITVRKPKFGFVKFEFKLGEDGDWQTDNEFTKLKPNKEYEIFMRVKTASAKGNFVQSEVSSKVTTAMQDVPSMQDIVIAGIALAVVLGLGIVLAVILHIRKIRKV